MELFASGPIDPSKSSGPKAEPVDGADPDKFMYIFGVNSKDDKDKKIVRFNYETLKFNYIEVPENMLITNAMAIIYIDKDTIYLTGGVNSAFNKIYNEFQHYNPTTGKCEKLPNFCMERFGHESVYLNNKLYLLGGKQYGRTKDSVLQHCECYDFSLKSWKKIAQMREQRVTLISFIYQGTIWVMGGCGYGAKRNRMIEKYNETYDYWEKIDIELNRGIEYGFAISTAPNEIITIGGKINSGVTSTCHKYNLQLQTVICTDWMQKPRVLQKAAVYNNEIYCLGGDDAHTVEKGLLLENEIIWQVVPTELQEYIKKDQCVNFSYATHTLHIEYQEQAAEPQQYEYNGQRALFFGNDEDPFIIEIRITDQKIIKRPVPLQLELVSFQAGIQLNEFEYFLSNGIKENKAQISKRAFIYNANTNTAKRLKDTIVDKFGPNIAYIHPYVYVISGRSYGNDEQAILKNCERYNLEIDEWINVASLLEYICSPNLCVYQEQIYVFGGYKGNSLRSDQVERYNANFNKWEILSVKIFVPNEAFGMVLNADLSYLLIFGGITQDYDSDQVEYYDISQGIEAMTYQAEKSGKVNLPRILPKVYKIDSNKILLMGGCNGLQNGFCEIYDTEKKEKNDEGFEDLMNTLSTLVDKNVGDVHLKQYLLL